MAGNEVPASAPINDVRRASELDSEHPAGVATHGAVLTWLGEVAERVSQRFSVQRIPLLLNQKERVRRELRGIPERMQKLANQAALVLELVDDYSAGTYRAIPWTSLAVAAGALLYSVSPSDVVPDFLPVLGQLDDALVIGVAMRLLRRDLKRYVEFKGYELSKYF